MSERGTDPTTEQRKAGPQNETKIGVEQWVENVFFGGSEVAILGFPMLFALMNAPFNSEVKFAAIVAVCTLSLAIGTVRQVESLNWPRMTPVLFFVRVVYHSTVIGVAAYGGAAVDLFAGSAVGSLVFVVLVSLGAVWLFPRIVAWLRRLPPWWTWGR